MSKRVVRLLSLAAAIALCLGLAPGLATTEGAAADPTVFFAVSPNSVEIPQGGSFDLSVVISSGGVNVSGGTFIVNYDHSIFSIGSLKPASPWTVTLTNPGTGNFSFTIAPGGVSPASGPIVTITFNQLAGTALSSSKVNVQDPSIRSAAFYRPASIDEKHYSATVGLQQGFPLWTIIPIVAVVVAAPVIWHLARKRRLQDSKKVRKKEDKDDDRKPSHASRMQRKEDMVALDLEFYNLRLDKGVAPAKLVRGDPTAPAFMAVTFQGQSIAERAFFQVNDKVPIQDAGDPDKGTGGTDEPTIPPVPAMLAAPTRLVFKLPPHVMSIPYDVESLLNWTQYELCVVPNAVPAQPTALDTLAPSPIREPEEKETAIEVPYRLVLSPSRLGGWAHSRHAVEHEGWVELWHTRLGVRRREGAGYVVDEGEEAERIVRAVYSPDYHRINPISPNVMRPFRTSLTPRDRHEIVRLSSDPTLALALMASSMQNAAGGIKAGQLANDKSGMVLVAGVEPGKGPGKAPSATPAAPGMAVEADLAPSRAPPPVRVNRLMLSTLGAWLDSYGHWSPPNDLSVEEWTHRAAQGRDHYVKVVYKGFLFPTGHRASLVKVTERRFERSKAMTPLQGPPGFVAYLRQRMYIVVLEHDKAYGPDRAYQGRQFPFGRVDLVTEVTPDIDQPEKSGVGSMGIQAFFPRVNGRDLMFRMRTTDVEGGRQEFEMPLVFVMNSVAHKAALMKDLLDLYPAETDRRMADLNGQKTAFAPSAKAGDTVFETSNIFFGAEPINSTGSDRAAFLPTVTRFDVNVQSMTAILGRKADAQLSYEDKFLSGGFGGADNKGEVFAKMIDGANLKLEFPGDKAGGLAKPDMSVSGLSRSQGAVAGTLENVSKGEFDPMDYFGSVLSAKVLGIPLSSIIAAAGLDRMPSYVVENIGQSPGGVPKQVKTTMIWEPELKRSDPEIFMNERDTGSGIVPAMMRITVTIVKDSGGAPPTMDVVGIMKDFEIRLLPPIAPFLKIPFKKMSFESHPGQKTVFDVEMDQIAFDGPLSFINALKDIIPLNGFDPPGLDITPEGVVASFSLAIPTVGFGVFSIQNINLIASLCLPFMGDPVRLRLAFCERHNPFLLTVSIYGGGGFFAMNLGPDGIELIEGSLEFGGCVAINLGVASGGIYVMAGVYFKMEFMGEQDQLQLTGYLRAGGALCVLGLITVSLEFYMAINYQTSPKRLWGEASVTVEVEVAFFSKSVSVKMEREFASSPPPTFRDVVPELEDWAGYCDAFGG
jgi:hypothetical protein